MILVRIIVLYLSLIYDLKKEMTKIREKILIYLKGMLMWACDVVPGVSGGTIAVITGIYERLIQAIKNVVPNLKYFFTWKWKIFWKNIDGTFLLILILWIGTSFVLFANLITNAIENYPILIWSFFVGLILISAVFLWKQVKRDWKTILCLIIFWVLAYFITAPTNTPLSITSTRWWTFICGSIAICAMILPWISGSFMLVLLWMYETMMLAIKGMLPKNSLGRQMIKKVRIYAVSEHENAAQKPELWNF